VRRDLELAREAEISWLSVLQGCDRSKDPCRHLPSRTPSRLQAGRALIEIQPTTHFDDQRPTLPLFAPINPTTTCLLHGLKRSANPRLLRQRRS
jgi:hypothetical protein